MTVQRTPTIIAMEAAFMIDMINSMPVPEPLPDDESVQGYQIVLLGWDGDDVDLPTIYASREEANAVICNDEFMVNAIVEKVTA